MRSGSGIANYPLWCIQDMLTDPGIDFTKFLYVENPDPVECKGNPRPH